MVDSNTPPPFLRCVTDEWPLRARLEALTYGVNTLSGVLALLECNSEPRSTTQVHNRIAEYGFGADPETFDAITYGPIQAKLRHLADEFTLIDSYEETRPPTKGRGGRIEPNDVTVFEKDPRGYWFGDPVAARTLRTCAELGLTPPDIFTSAEQKGATRAPFVTALVLQFLGRQGPAAHKAVLEGCFWEPSDRAEYNRLRGRISKNVTRLADCGLIDTESRQETVLKHTGTSLDTYPQRVDGSRMISETERILSYLEEETEVHRQELLADVQTSHSARILKHLREEGVVERLHGGGDERSWVALTGDGETVMAELIEPLFRAIHPDFSFDYDSPAEYERVWRETPTVDAGYLDGPFRETLQMYREHNRRYQADVKTVNQVDRQQNPWR